MNASGQRPDGFATKCQQTAALILYQLFHFPIIPLLHLLDEPA
jgi:hypothetical protein